MTVSLWSWCVVVVVEQKQRARCLWAQQQQEKTGRAGPHLIRAINERDKLVTLDVMVRICRALALEPSDLVLTRIRKLGSSPSDVCIPIFH